MPTSLDLQPGQTGEVALKLLPGAVGVSGADVQFSFDRTAIQVDALEPGDVLGISPIIGLRTVDNEKGLARIALARQGSTQSPTVEGVIVRIKIRAMSRDKTADTLLQLNSIKVTDQSFTQVLKLAVFSNNLPLRILVAPKN